MTAAHAVWDHPAGMNPEALNACFIAAMSQRCQYVPGGFTERSAGLAIAFTNLPLPTSYGFLTSAPGSPDELSSLIARAVAHGDGAGMPWGFVVLDDWLSAANEQTLIVGGMQQRGSILGMWSPRLAAPRRPTPAIEFRAVDGADGLNDFAAINNGAYGYDPSSTTALYEHYLHAPGSRAVVGWVDGEPVASAAAFPTQYGTYLGGVATIEQHRGKGYGEAASRHAIGLAMAGGSPAPAILFASPKRAAFYEPLGFVATATLRVFQRAANVTS
jgi:GNAT superfamily N-acetyltransferase